jgi:hypothetical protein
MRAKTIQNDLTSTLQAAFAFASRRGFTLLIKILK